VRVVQRASGGGAGSSLLSLGLGAECVSSLRQCWAKGMEDDWAGQEAMLGWPVWLGGGQAGL
jgi:hypothetical protein